MNRSRLFLLALLFAGGFSLRPAFAQSGPSEATSVESGTTRAINALWSENALDVQFKSTNRVIVADIKGPAEITMIHFAFGRAQLGQDPDKPLRQQLGNGKPLGRDVVLRIYWDGETNPSVECPLVDFFCDPTGEDQVINNAMIAVDRGFNAWFPMAFHKSAKVELDYEGSMRPGPELWRAMPCYSYVCYRDLKKFPRDTGYFHASWRQETILLGSKEYIALAATGKGKLIAWNVAIHSLYQDGYPVDENEKFYIDGETNASVEFQGLEDSFGFSWGFPATATQAPRNGYFPFMNGAFAYRFFLTDPIHFDKSLKIAIGFGAHEKSWLKKFSKPETAVQMSSTVYWYQTEPHAPLPPLPPIDERAPIAKAAYPTKN